MRPILGENYGVVSVPLISIAKLRK
jgi:hypothetical protein